MGHLGDTIGRKTVLFITLFGMGLATFLIGVLPTYDQIGFAAPILLLVLRVCQGLAVSGEQSSASSTSLEHAPANRRAFFTSFTLAGTQGGNILATAVFIPIAALPEAQLLSWGWRIPFLLSAVVVFVGWWIRRTLHESPAFAEEQQHDEVPTAPLKALFRTYTPDVFKVLFAALVSVISTIFSIYALTYGVSTIGLSRTSLLWMIIAANLVALVHHPALGTAGRPDRPQTGVPRRRPRLRGAGVAVHLGSQPGQHRAASSPSASCCPASSTPPTAASGSPCSASSSPPRSGCPAWPSAPSSASPSAGSHPRSRRSWPARPWPTGCPLRSSAAPPRWSPRSPG